MKQIDDTQFKIGICTHLETHLRTQLSCGQCSRHDLRVLRGGALCAATSSTSIHLSPDIISEKIKPSGWEYHMNLSWKLNRWVVWKLNGIKELWRARSLLYRRRFLRPNTHWKTFFQIYRIWKPLHRSKSKFLQKFNYIFL